MSIFRINVNTSFDQVLLQQGFTAPAGDEAKDAAGWRNMENVKYGDLILLCKGYDAIHAVAMAAHDCRVVDVNIFEAEIKCKAAGYRQVPIRLLRHVRAGISAKSTFRDLYHGDPFSSPLFCLEIKPLEERLAGFMEAMESLINS